jgi:Fe-S-cluster containining protein
LKADYQTLIDQAKSESERIKKQFSIWKKKKPKELDGLFFNSHSKAFKSIDCLSCANCCKTTSPIFREVDIKRIAKALRIKEIQFINDYLRLDEDSDYVLKQSPCTFLQDDNTCSIYEIRPLACREYPHTDRKNMHQILDLTEKNTLICPAVSKIVNEITQRNA